HSTWLSGPGGAFQPDEKIASDIVAAGIAVCTANTHNWRPIAARFGAERAQQIVGRVQWLAEQGVRLITGTDAGMAPFDNFPAALQGFARWDFTAERIIEMATVDTADALGLASTTGQLAAGLAADLLVLSGNPLRDITALGQLELVIAAGRLHRPAPVPL
ncbi:MAG: amidohydrolase family protein, partial [Pseudonocardiaceae bacterium]